MKIFLIILAVLLFLAIAVCGLLLYLFIRIFYSGHTKNSPKHNGVVPPGQIYQPHAAKCSEWIRAVRGMSHTDVQITSHDGLTLRGRYYEYHPGAPIELMLHGYRGNATRDLSCGVLRAFALGHSVLAVDNRGCGRSDGKVITFGVLETKDCLAWIDYILDYIDFSAKIILTGISMGASTVLITACQDNLPENVIGVIADCGYTSPEDIIKKVVGEDMKLPVKPLYPLIKLSAKLFGRFDLEEVSPIDCLSACHVPVIFFHGDADDFVPYDMSVRNFDECAAPKKKLVTIEGAGHGLCYVINPYKYINELRRFFAPLVDDDYPDDDTEVEEIYRPADDEEPDELTDDGIGEIVFDLIEENNEELT